MPSATDRLPLLARLGRWCHERRWAVVGLWLAALIGLGVVMGATGTGYSTEFSLPDVESAHGFDVIDAEFGGTGGGATGTIVFSYEGDGGVNAPEVREPMAALFAEVADVPHVDRVLSPYDEGGQRQIAADGDVAYAEVEMPRDTNLEEAADVREEIFDLEPDVEGLRVELGGQMFAEFEPPDSELIGLSFAIVILILAFGSVIAMGLPIGTAIAGIGAGVSAIGILSTVMEMPEFTTVIAVMIGLGVGIDYALFIVTRYREELHQGRTELAATEIALNTAGRAVLFAGTTVVISLLGMLIMGLAFVNGLAVGSALVVFVTMIASVTLLPALLGFVGDRIEVARWRGVIAAGLVAIGLLGVALKANVVALAFPAAVVVLVAGIFLTPLKKELPHRPPKPADKTFAYRWSRVIQHRPWAALIGGVVVLFILAVPVLSLRLGFSDEGNYPDDSTTKQAYDMLADGFGVGFNGGMIVVGELPDDADPAALEAVTAALSDDEGVAFVSPPLPNDPAAPTAVMWQAIPTTSPQSAETQATVERLRSDVLDEATAGTDIDLLITGSVAVNVDFSTYLATRLLWFLGAVLTLSFLLLMVVFRSLLVPLKAVVMNVISLGAAYGVTVAVFQWGWGASLLGVNATGPIEPFIPMMLFAIVFGLSMDYEVFLLSRVKEEYDSGKTNEQAVADGLAQTATVITAAAAIMVVVFGSFLLETDRAIKLMGFGLAVAVFIDATMIRMVLVPATMELLGDRNWWLPRWLDRILPKLDVEGASAAELIVLDDLEHDAGTDADSDPEPETAGVR
jgi:RND superfamily putative drug exporter